MKTELDREVCWFEIAAVDVKAACALLHKLITLATANGQSADDMVSFCQTLMNRLDTHCYMTSYAREKYAAVCKALAAREVLQPVGCLHC